MDGSSFQRELIELRFLQATRYSSVAAVVILLYDYLLCLPWEIVYIWQSRSKWNLGKRLYILNRYIPMINLVIHLNTFVNPAMSPQFCKDWFYIDVSLSWFSLAIIVLLLTVRTVALYDRERKITLFISLIAVLTMAALASVVVIISVRIRVETIPQEIRTVIPGCFYTEETNYISSVWICPTIFEACVCILTLFKAAQHARSKTLKYSPLFLALYRDGFLYFFVIFGTAVANLLVWLIVPLSLGQLLIMLYRTSMCVMSCRIILNLRRTGAKLSGDASLAGRQNWDTKSTDSHHHDWEVNQEVTFSHLTYLSTFHASNRQASEEDARRYIELSEDFPKTSRSRTSGQTVRRPDR